MKFAVLVHTKSKRPRVETDSAGILHIYVSALPVDGEANQAVIKSVAKHLKVAQTRIRIIRGSRSKQKLLEMV